MTGRIDLPSGPDTRICMASVYLEPSLKMWPTSMPRSTSRPCPQLTHASPAATSRRSAHWPTLMSRSTSTPRRWVSSALAPVYMPRRVRDDRVTAETGWQSADRAQAAGQRAQRGADLVRLGRADLVRAGGVDELLLVQRLVAAQQDQGEHAVEEVDEGLDLAFGRGLVAGGQILDGPDPGRVEGLRGREYHGPFGRIVYGGQPRRRLLDVRRVTALRAQDDQVLTGRCGADEFGGVRAAHRAAGRLDRDGGDGQPLEDPDVRVVVQAEGNVEPLRAQVEPVGVPQGELAGAHQTGLRPGLVAQLGLDLVPHLRQVAVGLELGGQVGDDLLVRHAEGQVSAAPVLEPEHLVAHQVPAAGQLPQLGRVHDRHHDLLGADPVHLLADDLDDLEPDPLAEGQQRVVPGHQRADEAGPEQQAVAGRARVCRVVAQRRDVHRGPAHAAYSHFHAAFFEVTVFEVTVFDVTVGQDRSLLPE